MIGPVEKTIHFCSF